MVAYMFNKFPDGFFEILAASLLQRENNISRGLYSDIIKLINDYTVFLEEHIKYCTNYDLCNTTEFISMKNLLSNIESDVDIVYSNIIRDILRRRYRIYKKQINMI
jgi:hypothetical protein